MTSLKGREKGTTGQHKEGGGKKERTGQRHSREKKLGRPLLRASCQLGQRDRKKESSAPNNLGKKKKIKGIDGG